MIEHGAYVVRRRDTGSEIVRISDFRVGDALVLLFHLCRNFSVEIDCPEDGYGGPDESFGYLWVPADKKEELDDAMRRDPRITWQFVCLDLFNGEECAFYRERKRMAVDIEQIAKRYFTGADSRVC